jgi:hypothetical protein
MMHQLVSGHQGNPLKGIFLSSPDLAPLDCYLFPNLKKNLKGRKFLSTKEPTLAADGWFAAQPKEFFLDG